MASISMASRLISSLLLVLTIGVLPLFAQNITCPEGSTLRNSAVIFTISAAQQKLLPLLGDFYSLSWQETLFQVKITFSPPHRTLNYSPLTVTETLISSPNLEEPLDNGFDLSWNLTSGPFTPPSLTSGRQITYYTQTISLRPICPGNSYSLITWRTNVCISGADAPTTLQWLTVQQRAAADAIFARVARGWFGTVSTDPSGNNCEHFDTRVSTLPTVSVTAPLVYQPSSMGDINVPGVGDGPMPSITETLSTTYAVIVGPGTTLSWLVGGTPTAAIRPVQNVTPTSTSVSTTVEIYVPTAGAVRENGFSGVLGLVLGAGAGFIMTL